MVPFDFPGEPTPNGYSNVVTIHEGSRLIWTSGQVAAGPDGTVPEGWEAQTRQVFRNLGAALAQAGAGWADVVKLTFYVVDTDELPVVRAVRDEFVNVAAPPTSTLIRVAGLFRPEFLIEVEAVAAI
ncbi:RidA family protein [Actinoplanes oblitus]|uniref:RidA family protein n=1 Tax=Actinoplanes oblitus TaxID=3040509 RepID=A0ABY8WBC8_9ACTN|nr:RidA family protein [Actinoplanes oblitus]WIM93704.1 RidA family protein [Actinoplanes oblitus]